MKKLGRHVVGWFFILLGIIGLFLPFLQGVLFLFIGAIILAPEVPFFQRVIKKMEGKHPRTFARAKLFLHRLYPWGRKAKPDDRAAYENKTEIADL